jgi:hypothetical protein
LHVWRVRQRRARQSEPIDTSDLYRVAAAVVAAADALVKRGSNPSFRATIGSRYCAGHFGAPLVRPAGQTGFARDQSNCGERLGATWALLNAQGRFGAGLESGGRATVPLITNEINTSRAESVSVRQEQRRARYELAYVTPNSIVCLACCVGAPEGAGAPGPATRGRSIVRMWPRVTRAFVCARVV